MEEEFYRLERKRDEINIEFDNFKKALELIEQARNCISEYLEKDLDNIVDYREVEYIDEDLFNAMQNIDSQLDYLKSEEDDVIEEQDNLHYGSYSQDDQNYISQWEFIPREKYE